MEARHAGHYALVNLCERRYAASRFPRGKLYDEDWTSVATPSIEQVFTTAMKVLDFLGEQ